MLCVADSRAAMASSLAYTLSILLCICSLQSAVMARKQKIDLTVYVHEIQGGPNSTLLAAAGTGQGNLSASGWGSILVFDDMLKAGGAADSKLLGKVTGLGAHSTIGGFAAGGVFAVSKVLFGEGSEYSGSSIIIAGTLAFPQPPWEVVVVGGTGFFRGFTGYVLSEPNLATSVAPLFVYKWSFYLSKH